MPRDFHDEAMIPRFERYLRRFFRAPAAATRIIHISPDFLSLHVGLQPKKEQGQNLERLEHALTRIARPWGQRLQLLFARAFGEIEGGRRWRRYADSFSRGYRTLVHPRFALRDVRQIEQLLADRSERFALWGPFQQRDDYRLQFYSLRQSDLNELMPFLEICTCGLSRRSILACRLATSRFTSRVLPCAAVTARSPCIPCASRC